MHGGMPPPWPGMHQQPPPNQLPQQQHQPPQQHQQQQHQQQQPPPAQRAKTGYGSDGYMPQEAAVAAFKALLADKGVHAFSRYERELPKLQPDKRFKVRCGLPISPPDPAVRLHACWLYPCLSMHPYPHLFTAWPLLLLCLPFPPAVPAQHLGTQGGL
jgi:hypothetical protein